jgi:hypothetical protein
LNPPFESRDVEFTKHSIGSRMDGLETKNESSNPQFEKLAATDSRDSMTITSVRCKSKETRQR